MALLRAGQAWSAAALKLHQWRRLRALIAHAWHTVPFYRARMAAENLSPEKILAARDFRDLPVLTRADLQSCGEELISCHYSTAKLMRRRSGGSTGQPVCVRLDAHRLGLSVTEEIWADAQAGWRPGEPVARIWAAQQGPPVGRLRRWLREHVISPGFTLDARRLNRGSFVEFVEKYRRWRPGLVVAYASALRPLAEFLLEGRVQLPAPRAVISSAELLDESTRAMAQTAFAAPVLDRYGCRELGLVAFQCALRESYHVNMLRIYLEILSEDGTPAEPGRAGKVVLTDLGNFAMPLIRYEIGDLAAWAPNRRCPCGTGAECLERIEGRTSDFVWSARGDRIHRAQFNSMILATPGIRQYRLVQDSLRSVRLEVVRSRPMAPGPLRQLREQIGQALGSDVEVSICCVDRLPQSASGKYRYVESRLPAADCAAAGEPA
jgi:phenylacetate-CoA ligase